MCGPMKNPKVETRSRDSNSGPHNCKADALPHDHGHHKTHTVLPVRSCVTFKFTKSRRKRQRFFLRMDGEYGPWFLKDHVSDSTMETLVIQTMLDVDTELAEV